MTVDHPCSTGCPSSVVTRCLPSGLRPRAQHLFWSLTAVCGLIGAAPVLAAQSPRLLILARDAQSNTPLSGVHLQLDGRALDDTTDAGGIARILGVPPGQHVVYLRLRGYAPDSLSVATADTGTTTAEGLLRLFVPSLPTVATTGQRVDTRLQGFERRRAMGGGFFFTHTQIDSSQTRSVAELLREGANALLIPGLGGQMYLASHSAQLGSRPCFAQIYLDGVFIYNPTGTGGEQLPPDLHDFLSRQLEAVEYYPDPASTPVEFRTGTPKCGTLVLWSRIH